MQKMKTGINRRRGIHRSRQDFVFDIINTASLTVVLLIVLLPMLNVYSSSISHPDAISAGKVWFWPVGFSLEAYRAIFDYTVIWRGYLNSLIYTALGTVFSVVLTLLAAYPLSRPDYSFRKFYMRMFTFTMIFNGGLIPFYLTVLKLGLLNTIWAMIIPSGLSVWNVFITRTFFATNLSGELLDASQIDGCSDFGFFFRIALPLSGAIIAVNALFYAVGKWNSYFDALLFIRDANKVPLQIILRRILVQNSVDKQLTGSMSISAASEAELAKFRQLVKYGLIVVSSLPVLCIYPFVQKFFVRGVMIGSIKG